MSFDEEAGVGYECQIYIPVRFGFKIGSWHLARRES